LQCSKCVDHEKKKEADDNEIEKLQQQLLKAQKEKEQREQELHEKEERLKAAEREAAALASRLSTLHTGGVSGAPAPSPAPNIVAAPASPAAPKSTESPDLTICTECGQKLSGKVIKALDKKWHKQCWVCRGCKSELEPDFNQSDGYPYCEKCYGQRFAPRCAGCGDPIVDSVLKALDKKWHKKCFVCTTCKNSFTGGSFFVREGKPYCASC